MGLFDFFKKKPQPLPAPVPVNPLSWYEKEEIIVRRTAQEGMDRFTQFPFQWNSKVLAFTSPNGHPFAYMDIVGTNLANARAELEFMNTHLTVATDLCKQIPKNLRIPVNEIIFKPNTGRGYTRIICTPYTIDQKESNTPITLSFMTDLEASSTTHGELIYGKSGHVVKANIYFWRKKNGYFFYYDTVDDSFVLSKIDKTITTDGYSPNVTVYKAPYILELEARREQEEQDFKWLQENLPEKCPKSLSGYRRMKTQNTKNFQVLKQLAADLGRTI